MHIYIYVYKSIFLSKYIHFWDIRFIGSLYYEGIDLFKLKSFLMSYISNDLQKHLFFIASDVKNFLLIMLIIYDIYYI